MVLPPADVDLILVDLGGLLVNWVVEVDGIGVLLPPVSPEPHATKGHQAQHHDGKREGPNVSWTTGEQKGHGVPCCCNCQDKKQGGYSLSGNTT